ncbi:Npun_R2821/Npun_R2822 family protein [Planktothrix sp. FACHB-1365]|uniref:Npun_R2821/Npun_R2822 family protein n=1 Tax=Planktothrix sp. FACHB-1365 TaxID=2692855 RepID=UPI001689A102|nr:Npun_R2821/Npun_R2822 family protein [Planktothrix sp. FACHB-1365]MBD2480624.1 sugar transferase [Planktothrix sp. FACHB-1365]
MQGICTLGNDVVYDQLVALLNSIDAILGPETPVCVFPFDEKLERLTAEISRRPNVSLYDNQEIIAQWDEFMAGASPASINRQYRIYGGHRRFCAFTGPFEQFVYMDADTLLMSPLDVIFKKLDEYDCVVYDFQFLHPEKVYNVKSPKLTQVFPQELIDSQIFCSGFYATKRGVFDQDKCQWLLSNLQEGGEVEVLYPTGDQPVLNYMFMRSGIPIYNCAYHFPKTIATGNSVTSSHFEEKDHILYDKGNRLTYLHYIGIAPCVMQAVCQGENIDFPYRDLFLYYRYLHEPEKRPIFTTPGVDYNANSRPSLLKRILRKLNLSR